MRSLASMELGVALEVVQPPEARLACLADVWLLLAVSQQVTLQIVMARKIRGAVWTLVPLVGRGRLRAALRGARIAHTSRCSALVIILLLLRGWAGIREGFITVLAGNCQVAVVARILITLCHLRRLGHKLWT